MPASARCLSRVGTTTLGLEHGFFFNGGMRLRCRRLRVHLSWTFPRRFAEVISGDGQKVDRERIELADTGPFGRRTLTWQPDLRGRKWVRFEVWDVAVNGAYTQPV